MAQLSGVPCHWVPPVSPELAFQKAVCEQYVSGKMLSMQTLKQEHGFTVTNFFQPKNLISECFIFIGVAILDIIGLFILYCYTGIFHVIEGKPFFFF